VAGSRPHPPPPGERGEFGAPGRRQRRRGHHAEADAAHHHRAGRRGPFGHGLRNFGLSAAGRSLDEHDPGIAGHAIGERGIQRKEYEFPVDQHH
jgi:hypothetical protein